MPGINTNFQYSTNWFNEEDFPSQSNNAVQVRAMMQKLPDEIRDALNALAAAVASEYIPFRAADPIPAGTVQSAIEYVLSVALDAQSGEIGPGAIKTVNLDGYAVTHDKLAENAVEADNIKNGEVNTDELHNGAVTHLKLHDDAVEANNILNGTITPIKFDATVYNKLASIGTDEKVLPELISKKKITKTASFTLELSHAGKAIYCNNTSDITITIPTNSSVAFPEDTEILVIRGNTGGVTFAKADSSAITFLNSGKQDTWTVPRRGTAVSLKKLSTNLWWLNGTPLASASIGDGEVKTANIGDSAVTSVKIGLGEVKTANIDDGAVTSVKIGLGEVKTANIDDGAVKTAKLDANAVTSEKIGPGEVKTINIYPGAIDNAKLGTGAVKTGNIYPGEVKTANIGLGQVTSSKLAALDKILLTTDMYNTSFPANPVEGQLFFKKV